MKVWVVSSDGTFYGSTYRLKVFSTYEKACTFIRDNSPDSSWWDIREMEVE